MSAQSKNQQSALKEVLLRPDVWRGESHRFVKKQSIKTGYEQLDTVLIQSGWPLNELVEISHHALGQGEWQLLSKAIEELSKSGHIVLISPPEHLYLAGLKQLNFSHERFLVLTPKSHSDFLYSFTAATKSQGCSAVICWEALPFSYRDLRKLQLSASYGSGLYLLFRGLNKLEHSSPASLKLSIRLTQDALEVFVHKQRGSFKQKQVLISLPERWQACPPLSSSTWLDENHVGNSQSRPTSS